MANKKKKNKVDSYPTIFVFDGVVRYFENGTMLELQSLVRDDEWKEIVSDTVKYHIFVECLKSIAFPELKEQWTVDDECWRLQLELAVSRIKNLDPFAVMAINSDAIKKAMSDKMRLNAKCLSVEIAQLRSMQQTTKNDSTGSVELSGL